jgi:ferritin-like metal-binding protein YciE
MTKPSIAKLFEDQLKDLCSAEAQFAKALMAMAKKASAPGLRKAFKSHLDETKCQIQRLEEVGLKLGIKLGVNRCKAAEGLIAEFAEILESKGSGLPIDAALIAAAERVERYEIAAYGAACAFADYLGYREIFELLQITLNEESAAVKQLSSMCGGKILTSAT